MLKPSRDYVLKQTNQRLDFTNSLTVALDPFAALDNHKETRQGWRIQHHSDDLIRCAHCSGYLGPHCRLSDKPIWLCGLCMQSNPNKNMKVKAKYWQMANTPAAAYSQPGSSLVMRFHVLVVDGHANDQEYRNRMIEQVVADLRTLTGDFLAGVIIVSQSHVSNVCCPSNGSNDFFVQRQRVSYAASDSTGLYRLVGEDEFLMTSTAAHTKLSETIDQTIQLALEESAGSKAYPEDLSPIEFATEYVADYLQDIKANDGDYMVAEIQVYGGLASIEHWSPHVESTGPSWVPLTDRSREIIQKAQDMKCAVSVTSMDDRAETATGRRMRQFRRTCTMVQVTGGSFAHGAGERETNSTGRNRPRELYDVSIVVRVSPNLRVNDVLPDARSVTVRSSRRSSSDSENSFGRKLGEDSDRLKRKFKIKSLRRSTDSKQQQVDLLTTITIPVWREGNGTMINLTSSMFDHSNDADHKPSYVSWVRNLFHNILRPQPTQIGHHTPPAFFSCGVVQVAMEGMIAIKETLGHRLYKRIRLVESHQFEMTNAFLPLFQTMHASALTQSMYSNALREMEEAGFVDTKAYVQKAFSDRLQMLSEEMGLSKHLNDDAVLRHVATKAKKLPRFRSALQTVVVMLQMCQTCMTNGTNSPDPYMTMHSLATCSGEKFSNIFGIRRHQVQSSVWIFDESRETLRPDQVIHLEGVHDSLHFNYLVERIRSGHSEPFAIAIKLHTVGIFIASNEGGASHGVNAILDAIKADKYVGPEANTIHHWRL
eukprot:Clim_evm20s119 gene=Clim_evmTU20s119